MKVDGEGTLSGQEPRPSSHAVTSLSDPPLQVDVRPAPPPLPRGNTARREVETEAPRWCVLA
jgi:hypothetical protein